MRKRGEEKPQESGEVGVVALERQEPTLSKTRVGHPQVHARRRDEENPSSEETERLSR